jgi:transcriptional regulator with XRE-family HTH domain
MAEKRLKLYGYYKFKSGDKDPIIDTVHTWLDDSGLSYGKAAELSGLGSSTIYNWIEGKTKKPQYCTIAALAGALGYEQTWTKTNVMPLKKRA